MIRKSQLALLLFLIPVFAGAQHVDHSRMDHSQMDHSRMDHSRMDHSKGPHEPIPEVTDADRRAAFPQLRHDMHAHGTAVTQHWIANRFEATHTNSNNGFHWDLEGSIGGDIQKMIIKSSGQSTRGTLNEVQNELLYSRGMRAWWDLNAGIRHDSGEGPSRTWLSAGLSGTAPGKIDVAATAFAGQSGRAAAKLEASYETLLTNRLIIQWRNENEFYAKADPARGYGKGWTGSLAGARLRYEIRRQFAPYVGVERQWHFGDTARMRRVASEPAHETHWVAGIRAWF